MADESALPKLPLTPAEDLFLSNPRPEKRVRIHNSSPPISSDPPFFSSDDDPSAENYLGSNGRQKRKFRGPWYNQEPDNSDERKPKRTLQRKFDSGIWLGSDSTEDEDDAEFSSRVHTPDPFNQRQTLISRIGKISRREIQIAKPPLSPEEMAEDKIGLCLEAGREEIDLSYDHFILVWFLREALIILKKLRVKPPLECHYQTPLYNCLDPNGKSRIIISPVETEIEALSLLQQSQARPWRDF